MLTTLLVLGALTAGAGAAQEPARTGQVPRSHGGPYQQLFAVPPVTPEGATFVKPFMAPDTHRPVPFEIFPSAHRALKPGPCNMPIIVGDAGVDPGILIPRTHAEASRIRIVAPPQPCREK